MLEILNIASERIIIDDNIELLAEDFIKKEIKDMDALHLASAIGYSVDYFCTADDNFLKKAKNIATKKTKIISPLELVIEILK